ncbi:DUF1631 family protein [Undibacterium jejuense]|uniref:DUF1631 family protein n=1 Tax=Undibacterium jejuense TaxID=1344949 RepID=A0A923HDS4_9BURK|nr:DUF1631 family protein [Undibacterium jejuense]MBC3862171.1 DUF1631 family protein [Undibacterium jejuense]
MQPKELLTRTRSEFFTTFQNAIQHIVAPAIETMFAKANSCNSPSEQTEIFRARAALQEHREMLAQQLSLNLDQLLDRSLETTYQNFRPSSSALSLSLDNIGLLDSSTFESSLRFNNITQLFRDAAGQELVDLNIRLAVLFGQDDICERENPFRPYLIARCISLSVEALKLPPEQTAILITQIGETLSSNVLEMYQRANANLAEQGISAQLVLKINKTPESLPSRSNVSSVFADTQQHHLGVGRPVQKEFSAPAPFRGAAQDEFPELMTKPAINIEQLFLAVRGRAGFSKAPQDQIVLSEHESHSLGWLEGGAGLGDMLRIAFGAEEDLSWESKSRTRPPIQTSNLRGSSGSQNLSVVRQLVHQLQVAHETTISAGGGAAAVTKFSFAGLDFPAIVGQMHKLLTPPIAKMLNEHGEVRNLIHEQREVLFQLARSTAEQMSIDVVAMVFESILFDSVLPINLRVQIGRLQFLLLQLALSDQEFLSGKHHPARVLLNRIATVALGVQYVESSAEQFEQEFGRIFKTLGKHDCEIPGLFERILNRFDTFVMRELRIQDKVIRRTVKSIEEAQIRYSQFEQTSRTLKAALAVMNLPPQFLAFLENEWVRAINLADRREPELAQRFRKFVPEVIWSIRPKRSNEERQQFSVLLQPMLESLRFGMDMLGWGQFKQNALLNWLNDAHGRALKPGDEAVSDLSLEKMYAIFDEFVNQPPVVISEIATEDKSPEMQKYLLNILEELGLTVTMLDADRVGLRESNDGMIRLGKPARAVDTQELRSRLISGVPIEMNLDGIFYRGCVHWVSPGTNSMVLSFKSHEAPAVISIDGFCQHLTHGTARMVESASLFDRAIASVLKSADALDR